MRRRRLCSLQEKEHQPVRSLHKEGKYKPARDILLEEQPGGTRDTLRECKSERLENWNKFNWILSLDYLALSYSSGEIVLVEALDVLLGGREGAERSLSGGVQLQVEDLLRLLLGGVVVVDVELTVIPDN